MSGGFDVGSIIGHLVLDVQQWQQGITAAKLNLEGFEEAFKKIGVSQTAFGEMLKKYGIGTVNDATQAFSRLKSEHGTLQQAYQAGIITQGQYQTATKKIEQELRSLEGTQQKAASSGGILASVFGQVASGFTVAALASKAISSTLSGIKEFFSSSIKGAMEEEASERRLATALQIRGNATKAGLSSLLAYAQAQSQKTVYTHEEIEATMSLYASLHKLDDEGIKQLTAGTIGLAATLGPGEGLTGATEMVNRAIEGNFAGLRRVGIAIDETLPKSEQLAQLQQKLASLLPNATNELKASEGQYKSLKKEIDETKEEFGKFILDVTNAHSVLENLRLTLQHVRGEYGSMADRIDYAWVKEQQIRAVTAGVRDEVVALRMPLAELQAGYQHVGVTMEGFLSAFKAGPEAFDKWIGQVKEANRLWVEFHNKTKGAGEGVFNLGEALKSLGITSESTLQTDFNMATKALDAYLKSGGKAPGVIKALKDAIADLGDKLGKTSGLSKEEEGSLQKLLDAANPMSAKYREIAESIRLVEKAHDSGRMTADNYTAALQYLEGECLSVNDALKDMAIVEVDIDDGLKDAETDAKKAADALQEFLNIAGGSYMKKAPKTISELNGELKDAVKLYDHMKSSGQYTSQALADQTDVIKNLQNQINGTVTSAQIWNSAISTMMSTMIQFGDGTGSILSAIGKNFSKMAETAISAIEMQVAAQIIASNKTIQKLKQETIAKWISDAISRYGIFGLAIAAAGFATINALFAKVLKFEKGGVFNEATLAVLGEGEDTEYALPEKKLIGIVRNAMTGSGTGTMTPALATAGAGGGRLAGGTFSASVNMYPRGVSRRDLEEAGSTMTRVLKRQVRRGVRLTR